LIPLSIELMGCRREVVRVLTEPSRPVVKRSALGGTLFGVVVKRNELCGSLIRCGVKHSMLSSTLTRPWVTLSWVRVNLMELVVSSCASRMMSSWTGVKPSEIAIEVSLATVNVTELLVTLRETALQLTESVTKRPEPVTRVLETGRRLTDARTNDFVTRREPCVTRTTLRHTCA
jgi:hypothetical protein